MRISHNGRVAIVTGAGRGLGRQYALDLARRGASVVVNDIGVSLLGGGEDPSVADAVVEEIRKAGGTAVASHDDITTPDGAGAMIDRAISAFGTVDILVNNAGIHIRKLFEDMTPETFAAVHGVHIGGSFNCCKAAWPVMKAKRYGRIVMTSSNAGLYGMIYGTAYASAKAAIIALAKVLTIEGREHGILINTICPMAHTRMSQDSMSPTSLSEEAAAFQKRLSPDWASAMVTLLSSEQFDQSGLTLVCGMGFAAQAVMVETPGHIFAEATPSPELLFEHMHQITDLEGALPYASSITWMENVLPRILKERYGEGAPAPT